MKNLPDYSLEAAHSGAVIGIDEVGRGPWAGPVVAAAALLNPDQIPDGIRDSKKLSLAKREALFEAIQANAKTAIGIASVEEIVEHNILGATMIAMQRAYHGIGVTAAMALIDGNKAPKLPCPTQCVVKGDAVCLSIAAASIIAKVTRDRMMVQLAGEYPHYGWGSNAGYGTAEHQAGIASHGLTVHHRGNFAPIRKLLDEGVRIIEPIARDIAKPVVSSSETHPAEQLELI